MEPIKNNNAPQQAVVNASTASSIKDEPEDRSLFLAGAVVVGTLLSVNLAQNYAMSKIPYVVGKIQCNNGKEFHNFVGIKDFFDLEKTFCGDAGPICSDWKEFSHWRVRGKVFGFDLSQIISQAILKEHAQKRIDKLNISPKNKKCCQVISNVAVVALNATLHSLAYQQFFSSKCATTTSLMVDIASRILLGAIQEIGGEAGPFCAFTTSLLSSPFRSIII